MGARNQTNSGSRESVFLLADIVGPGGAHDRFRARNLSASGVCIDRPVGIAVGMQLVVTIGQADRVGAEVMWVRDGRAGLKFATLIDTAKARSRPAKSLDPKAGWGRATAF